LSKMASPVAQPRRPILSTTPMSPRLATRIVTPTYAAKSSPRLQSRVAVAASPRMPLVSPRPPFR
jgi:hypothetical protein